MAPDYSFFALLFTLAQALAPGAGPELSWVNGDHPDQTITWTHRGDGWDLTVNGREMGRFYRRGGEVVMQQEGGPPQRFVVEQLMAPLDQGARRVHLRGSFAPAVLSIERRGTRVTLRDPTRSVLGTSLTLRR